LGKKRFSLRAHGDLNSDCYLYNRVGLSHDPLSPLYNYSHVMKTGPKCEIRRKKIKTQPLVPTSYSLPATLYCVQTTDFPISGNHSTISIDGFELNVVERRPPGFDENKKYPVIFHVYGGPGSQTVTKNWNIDFQAYLAGGLDYIVVTVDGRGTGFIGRAARCAVRGNIGYWESYDQIFTGSPCCSDLESTCRLN
jgi:dipeptidyl aminopeptidase/acylaminoacyl peptidase